MKKVLQLCFVPPGKISKSQISAGVSKRQHQPKDSLRRSGVFLCCTQTLDQLQCSLNTVTLVHVETAGWFSSWSLWLISFYWGLGLKFCTLESHFNINHAVELWLWVYRWVAFSAVSSFPCKDGAQPFPKFNQVYMCTTRDSMSPQ